MPLREEPREKREAGNCEIGPPVLSHHFPNHAIHDI